MNDTTPAGAESPSPAARAPADHAILTESLSRRFGRTLAVDAINLRIPRGSTYGLIGLSAAGKSTPIRMLMGLLPASSGRIVIRGHDPRIDPVAAKTSASPAAAPT